METLLNNILKVSASKSQPLGPAKLHKNQQKQNAAPNMNLMNSKVQNKKLDVQG